MKSFQTYFAFLIFIFCFTNVSAQSQLKVGGFSGVVGQFNNSEAAYETDLFGLAGSLEYPIKNISFRVGYSYLISSDFEKGNTSITNYKASLNLLIGKVFRKEHPFQIPVFIGYGSMKSRGDLGFESAGIVGRVEMRYYFLPRFALSASASSNFAVSFNQKFEDSMGIEQTTDLKIFMPQLQFGLIYCYKL